MTSDPAERAWEEWSRGASKHVVWVSFRAGWLAAVERAAEEVTTLKAADAHRAYDLGIEHALRDIRSLAPEAGDPATGG